jgi:hypothetical protein
VETALEVIASGAAPSPAPLQDQGEETAG